MKLTVFTPTYNRAYILGKLYESLCRQTAGDFEWIVVDDGSTDGTEALVRGWSSMAPFSLRYVRQANGGKHRAINRGVREARGELFFIVDSDDYLADNAVERVLSQYDTVRGREDFAGVCGMKVYPDGHRVGGDAQFSELECTLLEFTVIMSVGTWPRSIVRTFSADIRFPKSPVRNSVPRRWCGIASLRSTNCGFSMSPSTSAIICPTA
mgnify:CR=1 FL=1